MAAGEAREAAGAEASRDHRRAGAVAAGPEEVVVAPEGSSVPRQEGAAEAAARTRHRAAAGAVAAAEARGALRAGAASPRWPSEATG